MASCFASTPRSEIGSSSRGTSLSHIRPAWSAWGPFSARVVGCRDTGSRVIGESWCDVTGGNIPGARLRAGRRRALIDVAPAHREAWRSGSHLLQRRRRTALRTAASNSSNRISLWFAGQPAARVARSQSIHQDGELGLLSIGPKETLAAAPARSSQAPQPVSPRDRRKIVPTWLAEAGRRSAAGARASSSSNDSPRTAPVLTDTGIAREAVRGFLRSARSSRSGPSGDSLLLSAVPVPRRRPSRAQSGARAPRPVCRGPLAGEPGVRQLSGRIRRADPPMRREAADRLFSSTRPRGRKRTSDSSSCFRHVIRSLPVTRATWTI